MAFKEEKLILEAVIPDLKAHNRKQVFHEICKLAGYKLRIDPIKLANQLTLKEFEDSSGVGDGVAIPHLCIDTVEKPYMLFAKLSNPIDFDSIDTMPVDLVFLIISPKDGPYHLRRLASISRMFKDEHLRDNLRGTDDADTLYSLLLDPDFRMLAA
jgi:PTS system nitrogen regulatory IIA component